MLQEPLRLNEEETYNKVKNNWQHEAQGRQFYKCINICESVLHIYQHLFIYVSTSVPILHFWCQQGETQDMKFNTPQPSDVT